MAYLINGNVLAKKFYEHFQKELLAFPQKPRLDVIIVGDHPASHLYVQRKKRACDEWGIESQVHHCPSSFSEDALIKLIEKLNHEAAVNGILIQLPLPSHLNTFKVLCTLNPRKDVDGLHPLNLGALLHGHAKLLPCTPLGIMQLIKSVQENLEGAHALVIGRSVLVGKPTAALLTQSHATVTLAHSHTKDIADLCRQADIVVAAVGKPKYVQGTWLKKGAIVIDVGINRTSDGKICGDVDFGSVSHIKAITPVPGGVGPMTIANLLGNTLKAARLQAAC